MNETTQDRINLELVTGLRQANLRIDDAFANIPPVSGGSATWGLIIGTLANQTDLQAALNAKQNSLTFPLDETLGGTGVNNAGTLTNANNTTISGGGTVALGGFTLTVPATGSAAIATGIAGSQTWYGGTGANEDLRIHGTLHATKTSSYITLQESGGKVAVGTVTPTGFFHISSSDSTSNAAADMPLRVTRPSSSGDYLPIVEFGHPGNGMFRINMNSGGTNAFTTWAVWDLTDNRWEAQATTTVGATMILFSTSGAITFQNSASAAVTAGDPLTFTTISFLGNGHNIVGSSVDLARFAVDGQVDEIQAVYQCHSTQTANLIEMQLSTAAVIGRVSGAGRLGVTSNLSTTLAQVGGAIKDWSADVSVGGAETDIFTYTLPANTLSSNMDKVIASWGGNFVTVGTEIVQLKVYFGGTAIWDSTGIAVTTGTSSWRVYVEGIRVSSTVVRWITTLSTTGASGFVYSTYTEVTGLTLSGTNIIKLTGQSSGVGSGSGDIVGRQGFIQWLPNA